MQLTGFALPRLKKNKFILKSLLFLISHMCVSQEGVHMRTYHVLISKEINRVEFPRVGVTIHSKLSNVGAGNQVGPLQVQGLIITLKTKWEFWNSAGCMCVKEGGQF